MLYPWSKYETEKVIIHQSAKDKKHYAAHDKEIVIVLDFLFFQAMNLFSLYCHQSAEILSSLYLSTIY